MLYSINPAPSYGVGLSLGHLNQKSISDGRRVYIATLNRKLLPKNQGHG